MDNIDAQLDAANAKAATLETELAELKASLQASDTEKAALEVANSELKDNLTAVTAKLADSEAAYRASTEEVAQLKNDAKTAEEKAAEFYGAQAASNAAEVTAKGDPARPVAERFKAITDPSKQTEFLRSLSDAEKAELFANI